MSSSSFWSSLKSLDAYPKTLEDFRVKTLSGGCITIFSALLMLLLFASETRDYLTPHLNEELFVDTTRQQARLKINFDVVVHRISCDFLSLDAMDVSGEQHTGIEHNVFKTRLDLEGRAMEEPQREQQLGETAKIVNKTNVDETAAAVKTCGSCYGAETEERKCCNTCQEVKDAYAKKSWKFHAHGVDQCRGAGQGDREDRALKEGCQLHGYLEVNRVGGSFHIGPGRSYSLNRVHVHDVQPFGSQDFNLTHTVRQLSFGPHVIGETAAPLDGEHGFAEKGATMFQYYLKIVPTTWARADGSTFLSNQFSVTRHVKVVSLMSGETGMPGIFFNYELAPFMVKYSEKEKSLGHFLTGLCAIIGGVFTVAGILDKLVYNSARIVQAKMELGKAT